MHGKFKEERNDHELMLFRLGAFSLHDIPTRSLPRSSDTRSCAPHLSACVSSSHTTSRYFGEASARKLFD